MTTLGESLVGWGSYLESYMTFRELSYRFIEAQKAIQNINCGLQSGSQKVHIEKIYDDLADLWNEIEKMSSEAKSLTIVNYTV